MQNFFRKRRHFIYGWTLVAVLPLTGCTTVNTTAFTPIVLPNGCVVGDNYPTCKQLNATCSAPMSLQYSEYDESYDSQSSVENQLSNCKNLFTSCMDELSESGFIGDNKGQCKPQQISTTSVSGNLDTEVFGNIWYLNCADDKTAGIKTFTAATKNMPNSSAFTSGGTSILEGKIETQTSEAINYVSTENSGVSRACTANLGSVMPSGTSGLSEFCVSDFGSNPEGYKASLGGQSQSTVDYQNLPSTPTCKPLPSTSTVSTTSSTTVTPPTIHATPFTGTTVGVGYTSSTTQVNGTSVTGGNSTVSIGYTVAQAPITVGQTSVTPTIGVNTGVTVGKQGTVSGSPGTTTTQYEDGIGYVTVTTGGSPDTHPVSNTVAVAAQPGLILNNKVQVYANVGAVVASTQSSTGTQTTVCGPRVGIGAGVAVTNNLTLNAQGNSDSVGGTHVNSVGVGVSLAIR